MPELGTPAVLQSLLRLMRCLLAGEWPSSARQILYGQRYGLCWRCPTWTFSFETNIRHRATVRHVSSSCDNHLGIIHGIWLCLLQTREVGRQATNGYTALPDMLPTVLADLQTYKKDAAAPSSLQEPFVGFSLRDCVFSFLARSFSSSSHGGRSSEPLPGF